MVHKVQQVHRVLPVLEQIRGHRVQQVFKAVLVNKEHREMMELPRIQALKVRKEI
jgi:hypothetical protein